MKMRRISKFLPICILFQNIEYWIKPGLKFVFRFVSAESKVYGVDSDYAINQKKENVSSIVFSVNQALVHSPYKQTPL